MYAESVTLTGKAASDRWLALEKTSAVATPFSSLSYISAVSEALKSSATAVFVSDGTQDIAGLACFPAARGPITRILPIPLTNYCPILSVQLPSLADTHSRETWIDTLIEFLGENFTTLDIMLPPEFSDVRPFNWRNWTCSPLYTFRISTETGTWTTLDWSASTRRLFEKSADQFTVGNSPSKIDDVISFLEPVQLLQHRDGHHDVVLIKIVNALVVVK